MGCFDSVIVECPECGSKVEFQSKAGNCLMDEYTLSTAPPKIAIDIAGDAEHCPECNYVVRVQVTGNPILYVE